MSFKLTYSNMFDPPVEMHEQFESALARVHGSLGETHGHLLNGEDIVDGELHDDRSPINTDWVLARFPAATDQLVDAAITAAADAFPAWRDTPSRERIRILRRAGELIEERVYDISAVLALEVGKNRMEAIGEVQETADFFYIYCDVFEQQHGFFRTIARRSRSRCLNA